MSGEDGSVWVVFNGEIYNFGELRKELTDKGHQFRSDGDAEVLVHLYEEHGAAMLHRLRGMFALAVWDDRRQQLLLARDRLGIKPLYYAQQADKVSFASEARVLRDGHSIDRDSLATYLRLGWVGAPGTIYAGIKELPPGHQLVWLNGTTKVEEWWSPPHREHAVDSAGDLHDALEDAVGRHLVADVPLGVFLSSGLDSAAVTRLAAATGGDVRTYTVSFEWVDEAADAAAIASRLGLSHEVVPVVGTEILAALPEVVAAMDQPTVDGVNSWVISKAVRDAGCTVALSGLGGDEIFGGYSTFRRVPTVVRAGRLTGWLPGGARRGLAKHVAPRLPSHSARRALDAVACGGWAAAYAAMRGVLSQAEFAAVWQGDPVDVLASIQFTAGVDDADTVTQLELRNYLPNQLLRDTDVMSMRHSLEVRVPLLDDTVVAAALAAPTDDRGHTGKERLAAAVHPDLLVQARQPKQTFTLPFESWLRGPMARTARDAMDALANADVGVPKSGVDAIWERWRNGRTNWRSVWSLAVLGIWLDSSTAAPA